MSSFSSVPRVSRAARLTAVAALSGAAVFGATAHGAATASADPSSLMSMLPQGFSSSNCQGQTPKPPALEKVVCNQSSDSDGPSAAAFARYANADDMATGFQTVSSAMTVSSTCPGNQASPGPWTFGSNGQTGGQVACGTTPGDNNTTLAAVVWSDTAKLRVAEVLGSDINSLYTWWSKKSG